VVVLFAVDAALARRDAGAFVVAAAVSFVVVVLNPGAIGVLPATAHVATAPRIIVEEAPPDVLKPAGALFGLFAVAVLAAVLLRGGLLLAAVLLVPLLWLALSAQRHMVFFAFAAVPFLTESALALLPTRSGARVSGARSRSRPENARASARAGRLRGAPEQARSSTELGANAQEGTYEHDRHPRSRSLAGGVAVLLWIAALASIATAPTRPDETLYPRGALAALNASSGVLIHEYDWGGYLIWNAPERPVFVDGRLLPFMPDILNDHLRATLLRPGWLAVLDEHGVRQALLAPERPLAGALREEGWRVLAEDATFVLLERPR
jgi:hypothetical protein